MNLHKRLYDAIRCAAICLTAAIAARGAVIADCESGTNENNFGAYWYVYADGKDGGNSDITNATPIGGGEYEFTVTKNEGNPNGTPGYGARMDYKLGDKNPGSGSITWGSMVGIGTMLAPEGSVCDLTGATTITYWAKANPPVDVRVEVATSAVTDYCYHHTIHSITSTWTKYTVTLSEPLGIQQYSWGKKVALDLTKVEKIQWAVSEDEGAAENSSGSLWIDDVEVQPYTFVPPDACPSCVTAVGSVPANFMLADMEETRNGLGFYTFCYNDIGTRTVAGPNDYSAIIEGADNEDPEKPVLVLNGHGYDNTNGAYISFELGPTYKEGGKTIMPFVGIGTNLAEPPLYLKPFNATKAGATGIYFQYKMSGDVEYVSMEVSSDQNFGNAGAVYYIKLPNTNGTWKAANVPFSKLTLPKWEDVTPAALDKTKLTKIQWKVQGPSGSEGTLAIDNVVLVGVAQNFDPLAAVSYMPARRSLNGIGIERQKDDILVTLPAARANAHEIRITDMQGKIIARSAAAAGTGLCRIPCAGFTSGIAMVSVTDAQGNAMVTVPMSLLK